MQMTRLNIKRHNTVGAKSVDTVDLDEKIRRIREENKKREQRFQEIEEDKKMALDPKTESYTNSKGWRKKAIEKKHNDIKIQPCKNTMVTMKGVVQPANIKRAKGRGQRLVEMINNPLKADRFKSIVEGTIESHDLQTFKLQNNCRSNIREKINSKNKVCSGTELVVEHEEIQERDKKLVFIPEGQQNEVKDQTERIQVSEDMQDGNYKEEDVSPCKSNQEENETDKNLDSVEEQETVIEMRETDTLNKQPDSSTTKKKDTPKITLKKTASSSSFDESMAMLSPLDVPKNWGDVDFSDEELPPVSIWKNP